MYLERPNWINFARSPIERLISQFYFDKNSKLKPNNILQAKEKEVSRKFKSTKPLEKRIVVLKKQKSRQPRHVKKELKKKSIDLVSKLEIIYHKVASSSPSRIEAHAGLFRLLMKGIFDHYVL